MEVPNYINNRPIYGPVFNGLGTGLLGTAAAITNTTSAPSNYSYTYTPPQSYVSSVEDSSNYLQTIEALKEENEALKTKVELLEIQYKFILKKFNEVEKFMESRKNI